MNDIARFTKETVEQLDGLKGVKIERANLGPCPVCGKDVNENRKGYSCWSKDDPGCGFVVWKKKAGKNLPASVVKELMASLKESIERGDDPPSGRTVKPVTGFKGRSGRTFRAKLKIERADEGKWRVDFDEEWASNGATREPKPAEAEAAEAKAAEPEQAAEAEAPLAESTAT